MDIAVVGGGIAGLSAAWYLGNKHRVTLYERAHRPGLDANTVEIDCGQLGCAQINAPMRVFFPEYYPTLTALYRELNVAYEPVKYSGSFSEYGGGTYFGYRNYWVGSYSIPFLAGRSAFTPAALRLAGEIVQFLGRSRHDLRSGSASELSFSDYLAQGGVSARLAERFLYPVFAGICTCSYEALRYYPAEILLEYLHSGLLGSRVYRLTNGTRGLVEKLIGSATTLRCNTALQDARPDANGVQVTDSDGNVQRYDHIVIATQANQALQLLTAHCLQREREILQSFEYERSSIVVHTDKGLAPGRESEWAPVNFQLSGDHDKPMASILMNRIHPQLQGRPPVFETWNPFREIPDDHVLLKAAVERPKVTQRSLTALGKLQSLHRDADRRVWFCGSYAHRGIPLLESAVSSAKSVASQLNAEPAEADEPLLKPDAGATSELAGTVV